MMEQAESESWSEESEKEEDANKELILQTKHGRKPLDDSISNIWLLWRNTFDAPVLLQSTRQHVTIQLADKFVTIVHASSLYLGRRILWQELGLLNLKDKTWLVMGDFNAHFSIDERQGGRILLATAIEDFISFASSNDLMEASSTGQPENEQLIEQVYQQEAIVEELLDQEESILQQKTKVKWETQGER
ncbi:hypothetical protein FRX31_032404 [Thalictrum thalictroides]|uniref:Endonuclease/exonuclease/phosphatase domain-containing protein n=1 Tax=Thalictrum thalictroides TaxID=46969 RepID=A0A7J6UZE7_THATH|nr:hypothetical protein FRX31_032404 [Thalictrum thalictroides]